MEGAKSHSQTTNGWVEIRGIGQLTRATLKKKHPPLRLPLRLGFFSDLSVVESAMGGVLGGPSLRCCSLPPSGRA